MYQIDVNDDKGDGSGWYNKGTEDFLLADKADIALCSSCISNYGNIKIVGTLFIYEGIEAIFLVPKPQPVDSATFLFISISEYVWLCFIASLAVICFLLNLFAIQ